MRARFGNPGNYYFGLVVLDVGGAFPEFGAVAIHHFDAHPAFGQIRGVQVQIQGASFGNRGAFQPAVSGEIDISGNKSGSGEQCECETGCAGCP